MKLAFYKWKISPKHWFFLMEEDLIKKYFSSSTRKWHDYNRDIAEIEHAYILETILKYD